MTYAMMNKEELRKHLKIMLKGFLRTLHGTATAGLLVFAVYGFAAIPAEGGYIAVADFVVSVATLVVALLNVYLLGKGGTKRKGKIF